MKYLSILAFVTFTLISCNTGSDSKDGEPQASSKTNKNGCDCIEVLLSTLDSINTFEEFMNIEVVLLNTAPECEEIMSNSSVQEFVMVNCIEAANDLEIAANKKMESFMEEMSDQGMISDADADADAGADADSSADAGTGAEAGAAETK